MQNVLYVACIRLRIFLDQLMDETVIFNQHHGLVKLHKGRLISGFGLKYADDLPPYSGVSLIIPQYGGVLKRVFLTVYYASWHREQSV